MKYLPKTLSVLLTVMVLLETFTALHFYLSFFHDSIFSYLFNMGLSFLNAFVFLILSLVGYLKYYRTKDRTQFRPMYISLAVPILLAIPVLITNHRISSPSVLYCNSDPLNNVEIDIDFKENGTYEIITQGLGAVFSRGHYTRHDSIFILEKNWIDSLIVNKRLLNSYNGIMYQVDEQNKIIAGTSVFSVSKKRKQASEIENRDTK